MHLEPLPNGALRELLLVAHLVDIFALPLAASQLVVIGIDVVLAHASNPCMTCATRTHLAGHGRVGWPRAARETLPE
jgi:hypothetical protein